MSNALAFLTRDLAVDLGTASTLIYVRGRGIVLDEPSVVAVNSETDRVVAVGGDAKRMIGKTPPSILAVRPLKGGVIADFDLTERMLSYFITQVHGRRHARVNGQSIGEDTRPLAHGDVIDVSNQKLEFRLG